MTLMAYGRVSQLSDQQMVSSPSVLSAFFMFCRLPHVRPHQVRANGRGIRFRLKVPVFRQFASQGLPCPLLPHPFNPALFRRPDSCRHLETVAGTVANEILSDAILDARARVREGDVISGTPSSKSRMFPPMVVQMIAIGQESGSLDTMLEKVADFYDGEVDAAIASMTSAIEPIMIVFLGVTVGFIVIAMFMPLLSAIQGLSGGGDDEK